MVTETELQAKAVAPRVTLVEVEANIASEHFFTATEGAIGAAAEAMARAMMAPQTTVGELVEASAVVSTAPPAVLSLLTICVLVLRNGFTVIGTSACASPENFDAEIGRQLARKDAIGNVWPLMGYALRSKLSEA